MKKWFPEEEISLLHAMPVLDMERMPTTGGLADNGVKKLDLLLDWS